MLRAHLWMLLTHADWAAQLVVLSKTAKQHHKRVRTPFHSDCALRLPCCMWLQGRCSKDKRARSDAARLVTGDNREVMQRGLRLGTTER